MFLSANFSFKLILPAPPRMHAGCPWPAPSGIPSIVPGGLTASRLPAHPQVVRAKLQLVGVGCMLIAAKYEEIYAPQVEEFCYITDNTYDRPQVLSMERQVSLRPTWSHSRPYSVLPLGPPLWLSQPAPLAPRGMPAPRTTPVTSAPASGRRLLRAACGFSWPASLRSDSSAPASPVF